MEGLLWVQAKDVGAWPSGGRGVQAAPGAGTGAGEPERIFGDKDWMPRLVLVAKSSYVWIDQLTPTYGREIRRLYPDVHIFGGHSNTSFGLPQRKIMNNAFIILSILAGCDTLMIDPVMNPPKDFIEFKLGADVVLGKDEFAMRYMAAFRAPAQLRSRLRAAG